MQFEGSAVSRMPHSLQAHSVPINEYDAAENSSSLQVFLDIDAVVPDGHRAVITHVGLSRRR